MKLISCLFCCFYLMSFYSHGHHQKTPHNGHTELNYQEIRGPFVADYYRPKNRTQLAPILFVGGSDGGNIISKSRMHQKKVNDYVEAGYAVLSLTYFDYGGSHGLPDSLTRIPLEYFETAIHWLLEQPEVDPSNGLAIYGVSRGGELSLLLASHFPQISTVVALVPSAYLWSSYDLHMTTQEWHALMRENRCGAPAWTYKNQDVRWICIQETMKYEHWYDVINDRDYVAKFEIPVEKMKANLLLVSGTEDLVWPSTEMSNRIVERLKRHHYPYSYRHITYEEGHGVMMISWDHVFDFIEQAFPSQSKPKG